MEAFNSPKRVHIALVFNKIDRVLQPARDHPIDRFYLVSQDPTNHADRAERTLKALETGLQSQGIKTITIIRCWDMEDLTELLRTLRIIIEREQAEGNSVAINVSSGGTLHAIASMLISCMYNLDPYYVPRSWSPGEKYHPARRIPLIIGQNPSQPLVQGLALLHAIDPSEHGVAKSQFVEKAFSKGILTEPRSRGGAAPCSQRTFAARCMKVNAAIIRPGVNAGLLREEDRKPRTLYLTALGRTILRIFHDPSQRPHVDDPSP